MEITQILFSAAITITTIILTVVGIQLILVLKDIRTLVVKVNRMVKEFEKVGFNIGHGYSEITGFFSGLKSLFHIVDILAKKKHKKHEK